MKNFSLIYFFVCVLYVSYGQGTSTRNNDIEMIKQNIIDYDTGWDSKDINRVLAGYSKGIDWTNAFGDRVQGKEELKSLLEIIFSLDFVMSGKNNYQTPDITFLNEDIALARSTNIRTGQKWPDGSPMKDRIINHLRVYKKIEGNWLCMSHMISQAHEKQRN
ncbi:hypothetical protein PP182_04020 [Maribacter sp. PR1]|uniref:DUF4440 domain-containing protein n=1 Tax=Maribacter cobaltidurans TaxID=1178778 RepID=A0ABU7IQI7_9FLAO|nr:MULTISPECIES: hypothetical protein [Maribacter]MDC6387831.1 hypothetical protein [Maribacter sp. PR1]MEE1975220.1 hypothetical protein [Maribacter cobaltidurans]